METLKAAIPYLSGSAMIFLLCFLWVTALLDIRSRMRNGVFPVGVLVFVAVAISVLTVCLIVAADAVFIDKRSGVLSPWSEWGSRLGS